MIKVVIAGAGGRMGKALCRCVLDGRVPGLELAGAVDRAGCPDQGKDAGLVSGAGEAGVQVTSELSVVREADVFIDFTVPAATVEHARRCAEAGTAMVIGTTGLSDDDRSVIHAAAREVPVVLAPNMSMGVNLLFALVEQAARMLKGRGYDIEIVERHHRHKKDAPSGTAIGLGEAAAAGYGWTLGEVARHGRQGMCGARPEEEIGMHAVRGGDFVGDHTVILAAEGESVELSHRATSRDTFAVGGLQAALWVNGRAPGVYTMKDVLGVKI